MVKVQGPELTKFMEKRVCLQLNANRRITGTLRGYDQFMNIVLDNAIEEVSAHERNDIGMVVIRGNSVVMIEPLEAIRWRAAGAEGGGA
eukprot:CAMPEP_0114615738 /NCGR_PEP_ID=MMETSP0168-20121206/6322_1 /TAXON_ID=95228 ORGANISM="Vannella sp., Strain DIVA3 517/6/12" /NCGR_SAMPLE_ID=MMETSP0168 /ASSEMBLY_ACC=CAM_ASM_000044 /LENGTH=88 /DNA_ID=CAMNT_0001826823 /DNA_START=23 /DNA_END=290 /DNA_ORIENTATION=-